MRVASQELSVFRSLEIYHASIQSDSFAAKKSSIAVAATESSSSDPWALTMSLPSPSIYNSSSSSTSGRGTVQTQGYNFDDFDKKYSSHSYISNGAGLGLNTVRGDRDRDLLSTRANSPLPGGFNKILRVFHIYFDIISLLPLQSSLLGFASTAHKPNDDLLRSERGDTPQYHNLQLGINSFANLILEIS